MQQPIADDDTAGQQQQQEGSDDRGGIRRIKKSTTPCDAPAAAMTSDERQQQSEPSSPAAAVDDSTHDVLNSLFGSFDDASRQIQKANVHQQLFGVSQTRASTEQSTPSTPVSSNKVVPELSYRPVKQPAKTEPRESDKQQDGAAVKRRPEVDASSSKAPQQQPKSVKSSVHRSPKSSRPSSAQPHASGKRMRKPLKIDTSMLQRHKAKQAAAEAATTAATAAAGATSPRTAVKVVAGQQQGSNACVAVLQRMQGMLDTPLSVIHDAKPFHFPDAADADGSGVSQEGSKDAHQAQRDAVLCEDLALSEDSDSDGDDSSSSPPPAQQQPKCSAKKPKTSNAPVKMDDPWDLDNLLGTTTSSSSSAAKQQPSSSTSTTAKSSGSSSKKDKSKHSKDKSSSKSGSSKDHKHSSSSSKKSPAAAAAAASEQIGNGGGADSRPSTAQSMVELDSTSNDGSSSSSSVQLLSSSVKCRLRLDLITEVYRTQLLSPLPAPPAALLHATTSSSTPPPPPVLTKMEPLTLPPTTSATKHKTVAKRPSKEPKRAETPVTCKTEPMADAVESVSSPAAVCASPSVSGPAAASGSGDLDGAAPPEKRAKFENLSSDAEAACVINSKQAVAVPPTVQLSANKSTSIIATTTTSASVPVGKVEPMVSASAPSSAPTRPAYVEKEDALRDFDYYQNKMGRPTKNQAFHESNRMLRMLLYLEAVVYFVGALRRIKKEVRPGSTRPYQMLKDTSKLLREVTSRFMEQWQKGEMSGKARAHAHKVQVLSLRCQAILSRHMYAVYKDKTLRNYQYLIDNPPPNAAASAVAGSNGAVAGLDEVGESPTPSPASSSGSVPPGMVMLPQATEQVQRNQLVMLHNLMFADHWWSQAEARTLPDDREFFVHVDKLCGPLRHDSNLYEMSVYVLTCVHWLKTLLTTASSS